MNATRYLNSSDKLSTIKELYPSEKISEIIVESIGKYTIFENTIDNKPVIRLVASWQEAQKAEGLSLTVAEIRALNNGDERVLSEIYDKITRYLENNAVYNASHLDNWKTKVRDEFNELDANDKISFIKDAFSIASLGTTNAKGKVKGRIGSSSGQQQHKNKNVDFIQNDTVLISHSITGLYESRRILK